MENPIKMGWFGGTTIFGNTHIGKQCLQLQPTEWLFRGDGEIFVPLTGGVTADYLKFQERFKMKKVRSGQVVIR